MKKTELKNKIWNVGFYLRLSQEDDDMFSKNESNSISTQRQIIKNCFNKLENVNFVEEYVDDGYSGILIDRPRYQDMLFDIKTKKIDMVIVKDVSRFGRDNVEVMNKLHILFPSLNVRFYSILDEIDTFKNPDSIFNIAFEISCVLNEYYSKEISHKVKNAFETRKRNGLFVGSFAPFGYMKDSNDNHKLIIDYNSAPVVERIFNEYCLGKTLCQIAKDLNKDNIPSPGKYKQNFSVYKYIAKDNNAFWSDRTVRRILENDIYYGKLIQNKSKTISFKNKKRIANDEDDYIITENAVEPIISFETFEKTKSLLEKNRRIMPKRDELDIFSGFLKCGDCGKSLSRTKSRKGTSKTDFFIYYKCGSYKKSGKTVCTPHTIRKDKLEEAVLSFLKLKIAVALDFNKILEYINNFSFEDINTKRCERNLKQKEEDIKKKKTKLDKLYYDYQDGLMEKEDYLRRKDLLQTEIENELKQISKMQPMLEEIKQCSPKQNDFVSHFIKYKNIDKLNKQMIIDLIKQIKVYEDSRIEIETKFQDEYLFALQLIKNNQKLLLRKSIKNQLEIKANA